MAFFAEDVGLLACADMETTNGGVYVWKFSEVPQMRKYTGIGRREITGQSIICVQIGGNVIGGIRPKVCWHCHNQNILVVAIGNYVLKFDATKLGEWQDKLEFENLIDGSTDGVKLVGLHDQNVTALSMMENRLVSASMDGKIKVWDVDWNSEPIAVLQPYEENLKLEKAAWEHMQELGNTISDQFNEDRTKQENAAEAHFRKLTDMINKLNEDLPAIIKKSVNSELTTFADKQKEKQKQMAPATKEELQAALEKSSDGLFTRLQYEIKNKLKGAEACMRKEITRFLKNDAPHIVEKTVKSRLTTIGQSVARTITPTIEGAISTSIAESFQEAPTSTIEKAISTSIAEISHDNLFETIEKAISTSISESFQKGVGDKVANQLEKLVSSKHEVVDVSVNTAFEMARSTMLEHVDAELQKGIAKLTSASQQQLEASLSSLALELKDAINSASSVALTLSSELHDGQRQPLDLAVERATSIEPIPFISQHDRPLGGFHTKLCSEIEELKRCKQELTQKMAEAEQKILRLENRCTTLESTSNISMKLSGDKTQIESPGDFYLNLRESILIVGGYAGESWSSALHCFSPAHDVLRSLKPMSFLRSYASVAKFNGELYVFGGGSGTDSMYYDTVESYNAVTNQWTLRPSLNKKKFLLGGAALNGKIFAVGGGNGVECFADVEMFDPYDGRWMISPVSMLQKRFALAAVELNGALYAVGGFDGSHYLKSAERFDPREPSWTEIESMVAPRGFHSMVAMKEKLYVLGGFDGDLMVPTVEIYDPRLGTWMTGEPMSRGRLYFAAAVLEESIYVIGGRGYEEADIVEKIECYKEGQGRWKETNLRAVGRRCCASAIVLGGD